MTRRECKGIRIAAVGDLTGASENAQNPFDDQVSSLLRRSDIVFGNYEAVIAPDPRRTAQKAYCLEAPPGAETSVRGAGFTVLNVANNHMMDFGADAARATVERLNGAGIQTIGAGRTLEEAWRGIVTHVRGNTVALIGATESTDGGLPGDYVVATLDETILKRRIVELAALHDYVVVSLHWGTENVLYPSPSQQCLARACIDWGARVVFGHHPHRVQGIERYAHGLIVYSLGNFNFMPCGVGLTPYENLSMVCEVTLSQNAPPSFHAAPILIDSSYCPRVVEDESQRTAIQQHLEEISKPLPPGVDENWWYAEISRPYLLGNLRAFGVRIKRYGWRHLIACLRWLLSGYNRRIYRAVLRRWIARKGRPT